MKRRAAIASIVAGAGVMCVAFGLVHAQRADESTMYLFGLGGALTVIVVGVIQRR